MFFSIPVKLCQVRGGWYPHLWCPNVHKTKQNCKSALLNDPMVDKTWWRAPWCHSSGQNMVKCPCGCPFSAHWCPTAYNSCHFYRFSLPPQTSWALHRLTVLCLPHMLDCGLASFSHLPFLCLTVIIANDQTVKTQQGLHPYLIVTSSTHGVMWEVAYKVL